MRKATCSVTFLPFQKTVTVTRGLNLLEAALQADLLFNHVCGGSGGCLRCKLLVVQGRVEGGDLPPAAAAVWPEGTVLACRALVTEDVTVQVPPETQVELRASVSAQLAGTSLPHAALSSLSRPVHEPAALVKRYALKLEKPSLTDNLADEQRIRSALEQELAAAGEPAVAELPLELVKQLPGLLKVHDYRLTLTVGRLRQSCRVLALAGGDSTSAPLYLAVVDVGTTTVVAHLVEATTGKTVAARACYNSQGVHGRDVTARMIAAEKKGVAELQALIIADLNRLLQDLLREAQLTADDIMAVVCAGNTVMCHLLLALPVETIRRTPFVAVTVEPPVVAASTVGLKIHPRGLLYVLPGISAWVGSDITAGILATGMQSSAALTLLVDIGTNGEIVIGHSEWLMAAAASAGPALEGAHMSCGMRAEPGAIEQVYAEQGTIKYKTIGGLLPRGVCGSGIIDLLSVLLQEGIINRSGKFTAPDHPQIDSQEGRVQFRLVDPAASATGKAITISETDLENIMTAKAAIFAAIHILMQRLSLRFADLEHFYLAGAFGSHLNLNSCRNIGLIPPLPVEKIRFVGNSSLEGAKLAALHTSAFEQLFKIRKETIYYDLMGADDYVAEFRKALFLPHTDIELFNVNVKEVN